MGKGGIETHEGERAALILLGDRVEAGSTHTAEALQLMCGLSEVMGVMHVERSARGMLQRALSGDPLPARPPSAVKNHHRTIESD